MLHESCGGVCLIVIKIFDEILSTGPDSNVRQLSIAFWQSFYYWNDF